MRQADPRKQLAAVRETAERISKELGFETALGRVEIKTGTTRSPALKSGRAGNGRGGA